MLPPRRLAVFAVLTVGAACGGGAVTTPVVQHPTASASTSASSVAPAVKKPSPIGFTSIGSFGAGTFGPRVVRGATSSILVSGQRTTSGRRWIVQALDDKGAPRGDAKHEVAEAPEDTSHWDVEPIGDGFVLAWTRPTDAGHQLLVVPLAPDGGVRGPQTIASRSGDEIVSVDVVPLSKESTGAVALLTWGELKMASPTVVATGSLFATSIDALARPTAATPTRIGEHLSAWHVISSSPTSAVAALIERDAKATGNGEDVPRTAKIVSLVAGPKGLDVSDGAALTTTPTALPDARLVVTGPGRALCVWEDRRDLDVHVFAQAVDLSSSKPKLLGTPRRANAPRGDASLSALVETKSGPVLLWEDYAPRPIHEERRRFDLVRLTSEGEATSTPRAIWFPYGEEEPEISGDPSRDDVALLTYGTAWLQADAASAARATENVRPFVVRFGGATLDPIGATMLDVGDAVGAPAMHAFDLFCVGSGACDVLVDGALDPAPVVVAHVPSSASNPASPWPRWTYRELVEPIAQPPRLEGAETIAREPSFAGMHAARTTHDGQPATLVAWVTYAADDEVVEASPPPEPKKGDKKKEKEKKAKKPEGTAHVAARLLDASGAPIAPIALVSERALSKGDVAIAAGASEKDGAVVAYVSRADGDDEVFVARIDADGKKTGKSSRITHSNGSASDVAIAPLPEGGWLLGWVDGRKDTLAVYVVRLDKHGDKQGTEVKIGGGTGGDVSDLVLVPNGTSSAGPRVLAAWTDAREDTATGFGDIWFTVVNGKNATQSIVSERALVKSKLHSHAPVVATRADGSATIAWLEDDPQATELMSLQGKPDWGAYVARVDASGAAVQAAIPIAIDPSLGKGVVTGVAMDCAGLATSCRVALAWGAADGIALLAATIPMNAPGDVLGPARAVWSYRGAPTQEVAPALAGASAFLCEDGLEKDDGRVRRLAIAW